MAYTLKTYATKTIKIQTPHEISFEESNDIGTVRKQRDAAVAEVRRLRGDVSHSKMLQESYLVSFGTIRNDRDHAHRELAGYRSRLADAVGNDALDLAERIQTHAKAIPDNQLSADLTDIVGRIRRFAKLHV